MNTMQNHNEYHIHHQSTGVVKSNVFLAPNTVWMTTGKHGYPKCGTSGAAAYDLQADLIEPITIQPNKTVRVGTGIKMSLKGDVAALVLPRSGLAMKNSITVANTPGLIDPDYRGELMVLLRNEGDEPFTVNDGDRIAQLMFMSFISPSFVSVEELDQTERGSGGFGSTDRK